ncbi:MAG: aldose 1-epimerase [Solirubrobacteraceae bacterium]|nr:aldose 1-epimerase [Solirubrobacteraceae bacterium]
MAEPRPAAPRDLGIVELTSPDGELVASFATGAGMVGCSLRHRGDEVLGIGEGLEAYLEEGAVFGVPLLYPWANRLGGWSYEAAGRTVTLDRSSPLLHADDREHCLPIHGALAASSDWVVAEAGSDDREAWLTATLDYGEDDALLAVFPFAHRVELDLRVADGALRVTTTVDAAADPVPLSFGFHPYLAPPGAAREEWVVDVPERTEMLLDERSLPTGEVRPREAERLELGARTFDDLFAVRGAGTTFAVTGGGRRLTVEFGDGYPYAQVFAPDDQAVICFEPMTAPVDALRTHDGLRVLEPGGRTRARFALRVEDA